MSLLSSSAVPAPEHRERPQLCVAGPFAPGKYTAADQAAAAAELERFAAKWQDRYPPVVRLWRAHWEQFTPFLAFRPGPAG